MLIKFEFDKSFEIVKNFWRVFQKMYEKRQNFLKLLKIIRNF